MYSMKLASIAILDSIVLNDVETHRTGNPELRFHGVEFDGVPMG